MVAGETCGLAPVRAYFSWRDMAICAVTPLGNSSSAHLRLFVDGNVVGAGSLANGFGDFQRVALDDEIQVADPETGQHVAHGAAGQEDVDVRLAGRRLDVLHRPVLIRAQVALQHVDVVAHRVAPSTLTKSPEPRPPSRPVMRGGGASLRCLEAWTA